jgi:hypothetical protein
MSSDVSILRGKKQNSIFKKIYHLKKKKGRRIGKYNIDRLLLL